MTTLGEKLTKNDIKVYAAVLEKPGGLFANATKGYDGVSSHLTQSFPGKVSTCLKKNEKSPWFAAPLESSCSWKTHRNHKTKSTNSRQ